MTTRMNVHLNKYSTLNHSIAATGPFYTSEQGRDYLDSVTVITVEKILGAPTTVTITPKFQLWHSVIGGNQTEANTGASGVDPVISWVDLSAASNPSLLPDGDWPTALDVSGAGTGYTTPVIIARRISGGFPWRLKINWAFTGGTSPRIELSAVTYSRERFGGGNDRGLVSL